MTSKTFENSNRDTIVIEDTSKWCADCRDGEHENYSDPVRLVIVRDPETKKWVKRAKLCPDHIEMYLQDGYEVIDARTREAL